ncbi:conserved Plasmodium protein, unknown function [Plasmodium vivax]|uniref:Uncharacterized protein n=6 Tax=Plasmodium vivax TaxID=5855 RepID=A5JZS2_PLAVS|nr:hypothetical protein, conserved [Plasmodium vivax]KMZ78032.1 hypothetical protein PVIIG_00719 [Plasmodium vivax India VII]KMZ84372.1 hypothetical protein PVBG_00152 [Plasmodium vivax Brazil I]KMZ90152.1 hypothetical protein PVMG_01519 [Plasmodium vivax Mauritania I]KMZ96861.1 hypothetical protein PVNG_01685 [Plasmodium vivax North Korean]EDL47483.1 hypothetical protein, conserved [Plasmodium vivax]|eukprot:XP_001617210.1 hypothetical protein [Plasmodium vivax Sal-1]
MDYNILYDWYKTFSCHKTIRKINTFVSHNKEKANVEELKIINENKYVSHSIAILTAIGILTTFRKLRRAKLFMFRPFLPDIFGLITSCSFLYMHALYLSRNTISKLIQLNLKESSNEGIGNYVGEMYKKDEPKDYLNLVRKAL